MCVFFVVHNRCLFNDSQLVKMKKVYSLTRGEGHSLKICGGYVRPHWPPFSNRLSLNDPFSFFTFCSHLMTPFSKCSLTLTPFLEIFIDENGRHALTEWRPFLPINDHLVICIYPIFVWPPKWPPFFLQTEVFTKRPLLFFYSPHQMTPYFSFVLTERPLFFFI